MPIHCFGSIAMTCYPLGGLLADVYFGRYKIIRASLIAMAVSMIVLVIVLVATLQTEISYKSHSLIKTGYVMRGGGAFLILAIGLAGFTSIMLCSLDWTNSRMHPVTSLEHLYTCTCGLIE